MNITYGKNEVLITDLKCFSLALSLDCGQAFRWFETEDGSWHGIAAGRSLTVRQDTPDSLRLFCSRADFDGFWRDYFDLDRDYATICSVLCEDEKLRTAVETCPGIRILRQEPWETLCSFIISQNNNIPRIKGIIGRLCESFGTELDGGGYSFPDASILSSLEPGQLAPLRAGFRAIYIVDAARKVTSGETDLKEIAASPCEYGRQQLQKIVGVGAKVAECTLLYGFGRLDAFPVDVWVRRLMGELYPEGLPACTAGYEGVAQQFLFHWRRKADSVGSSQS